MLDLDGQLGTGYSLPFCFMWLIKAHRTENQYSKNDVSSSKTWEGKILQMG